MTKLTGRVLYLTLSEEGGNCVTYWCYHSVRVYSVGRRRMNIYAALVERQWQVKTEMPQKKLSQCYFVHHITTWNESAVTNRLSHGTALGVIQWGGRQIEHATGMVENGPTNCFGNPEASRKLYGPRRKGKKLILKQIYKAINCGDVKSS